MGSKGYGVTVRLIMCWLICVEINALSETSEHKTLLILSTVTPVNYISDTKMALNKRQLKFALDIRTKIQGCVCGVKFLTLPRICWQNYTTDFAACHNATLFIYI